MNGNISAESSQGLPRKLTAVGTVGHLNQLFTVYEKNWNCPDCSQENYAARPRCLRCKRQKPANSNNYVMDPALAALQAGQEIAWQEVVDPNTMQIYYYNKNTGVTQWERPAELGQAPFATGWFGRGKVGASVLYEEMNKFYLSRPSKKQKEAIDPKKYHLEGAQEFNIWYGRYIGDFSDKMDREPATDRCKLENDAGYTRADLADKDRKDNNVNSKKNNNKRFFCIHFAHGVCAKGVECPYYHRVPTPEDDARCDELFDCFGRQRHNKHKDDMSGVGTFSKPCRTLFVGNLLKNKYESPKALEDALYKHFGEWGELESINVIHRISIAFPRYRLRTSAEYAKEAMACQALDHQEILSIRWAHDDPNPVAKDSIARADRDAMVALLQAKGISLTPAAFEYPADYPMPDAKRVRLDNGQGSTIDVNEQYPQLAYPNTDGQFNATSGAITGDGSDGSNNYYEQYYAQYYAQYQQQQPTDSSSSSSNAQQQAQQDALHRLGLDTSTEENKTSTTVAAGKDDDEEEEEDDEAEEGDDWQPYVDETTGATYYFNSATGESSWTAPEHLQCQAKTSSEDTSNNTEEPAIVSNNE